MFYAEYLKQTKQMYTLTFQKFIEQPIILSNK